MPPDLISTSVPGATTGPMTGNPEVGCAGLAIRHVLVPLDGSSLAECALPWAVAVAQALPARVTLLRVLEKPALSCSTSHHHDAVDWEMRRVEAQNELTRIDREVKARKLTSSIEESRMFVRALPLPLALVLLTLAAQPPLSVQPKGVLPRGGARNAVDCAL